MAVRMPKDMLRVRGRWMGGGHTRGGFRNNYVPEMQTRNPVTQHNKTSVSRFLPETR